MSAHALFLTLAAGLLVPAAGQPAERPAKKVLLVGIDGCRLDAVLFSQAKHLKKLIAEGAFSEACDVLGDRETKADTASGSGWSTILTGVLADKHGVNGNDFRGNRLADWPSVFHRVSAARPRARCAGLVTWAPFREYILKDHAGCRLVVDGDKKGYLDGDRQTADAAVKLLSKTDPTLLFVYFGHVDSAGHGYGFHPRSPKYTNAIEEVDKHLGRILDALHRRPAFAREDWLILVCTDHGGKGRGHGGGRTVPEMRTGFLILHGKSVPKGKLPGKTTNADIVPTVLGHLGIPIDPAWKLDGKAVGRKGSQGKSHTGSGGPVSK
jgi:predicted AlkP superfamily pyrophosphatase or phosphodiesterase